MSLGWDGGAALAVVLSVIVLMAVTHVGPELILLGGLLVLMTLGVLTPEDALSGLTNQGMVTVAVLFVVAAAVRNTGAMEQVAARLLGRPRTVSQALPRLMLPISTLSAVLNNTPVVAIFIPTVSEWAKKGRLPVSKLLLPMSYAAILGGTWTLIGTSTNLVVNGLWMSEAGRPSMGIFEITRLGVPCTIVGFAFIMVAHRWLLPKRAPAFHRPDDPRQYTVEMMVAPDSPLVGTSIEASGLRHLQGLYLLEIQRQQVILPAVEPSTLLQGDDRLVFVGVVEQVVELQRKRGLLPATRQVFQLDTPRADRLLFEAVVSPSCRMVGKTIREGKFRTVYNAAVIAVARAGERLSGKIGDVVLRPGDTLLVEAHPSFAAWMRDSREFYLVSPIEGYVPPRHDRAWLVLPVLALMVLMAATGWLSMLHAAALAAAALLLTGAISGSQALRSIDWQVLLVIVAAFGLGRALQVTGAAQALATGLIGLVGEEPWLVLLIIYGITSLFTELITNNGSAVLVFPIALAAAERLGVDPLPYMLAIMMAASASFATPIGYQTNMMVYGPGGYRFSDYLRIGVPLNLLMFATSVILIPLFWSW